MSSRPVLYARPTPVTAAPRLAVALGLDAGDLVLKRDDLIGLGGGGNKVRKLEYAFEEAAAARASVVVTTGAPQSNHARLTAAAGAVLGLDVVLVLRGDPPQVRAGNLVLDDLFGAEVVWAGEEDLAVRAQREVDRRTSGEERAHLIPFGGTSPTTAQGYAEAAREILDATPDVRHVVVAAGSGGTMAGLVSVLGPERVLGVDVGALPDVRGTVAALVAQMPGAAACGADALRVDHDQVGPGYPHLTAATRSAMEAMARSEGVVLDPVYTGRALAGLVAAVRQGGIRRGERVVFVHTGGLPGLFGHPEVG